MIGCDNTILAGRVIDDLLPYIPAIVPLEVCERLLSYHLADAAAASVARETDMKHVSPPIMVERFAASSRRTSSIGSVISIDPLRVPDSADTCAATCFSGGSRSAGRK